MFTAISAAATVAAAKAVFCSKTSVPKIPGRIPCSSATCRISRIAAPADGQRVQCWRRRRRNDRDTLQSCRPPEDLRRVPQRLRWSSAQQREHRFRSVSCGQGRQDPCLLWQRFQPTPCRLLHPRRLAAGQFSAELIHPAQRCQSAQFPANADANQAEPSQENHKASPTQCAPVVEQRTYQPCGPQDGIPIARIPAPTRAGDARERTGSAVGKIDDTASNRGAGSGSSNRKGSGAVSIKECPPTGMLSMRPIPVAVCRHGPPRANALAQSRAMRESGVARMYHQAARREPHRDKTERPGLANDAATNG